MTLHLSPSGRTCGGKTDNSDSPGGYESEGVGPQLVSNWKTGHRLAMAACVKDPVLTGAPLAGKEDPVTPATRSTNNRKDDSSSGEARDQVARLLHLKGLLLHEVAKARPKPQSTTAVKTLRGQGLLERNGLLTQPRALGA